MENLWRIRIVPRTNKPTEEQWKDVGRTLYLPKSEAATRSYARDEIAEIIDGREWSILDVRSADQ